MLPVAILAGGLATRLRPVSETVPKALIEINGEPFIAHQLRLLSQSGVSRVVICIGHLGEAIREFAGDGRHFGVQIAYSDDGPVLRGTAGAIRNALPLLGDAFFVLYGDSYLPCDYREVKTAFRKSGLPALMTVFHNRDQWEKSNVEFAGGLVCAYDKTTPAPQMEYVDYGLSAFRASAFLEQAGQARDLAEVFQRLAAQRRLAGWEVKQRFYEVGSWSGIRTLEAYLNTETALQRAR
jgi:NDP-sugar pyrophosphorylase family protein